MSLGCWSLATAFVRENGRQPGPGRAPGRSGSGRSAPWSLGGTALNMTRAEPDRCHVARPDKVAIDQRHERRSLCRIALPTSGGRRPPGTPVAPLLRSREAWNGERHADARDCAAGTIATPDGHLGETSTRAVRLPLVVLSECASASNCRAFRPVTETVPYHWARVWCNPNKLGPPYTYI